MEDFEIHEHAEPLFEQPANDLAPYIDLLPASFREYLDEHGMLCLSFDEIETRLEATKILPERAEHAAFFAQHIHALRQAALFYGEKKEILNSEITAYSHFFPREFLQFLRVRQWSDLSLSDMYTRYVYFSAFDPQTAFWYESFETVRRIDALKTYDDSPINVPLGPIIENEVWEFSDDTKAQLLFAL